MKRCCSGNYVMLPASFATARMRFDLLDLSDAASVFESFASDPEVTRMMPWPKHNTLSESEAFIRDRVNLRISGKCQHWVIREGDGESVMGIIGLAFDGDIAEVGYAFKQTAWGAGYATEALGGVLHHAFADPNIHRVWGWCDVENTASARVMEKAGLMRVELKKRYGLLPGLGPEPRDAFIYETTR